MKKIILGLLGVIIIFAILVKFAPEKPAVNYVLSDTTIDRMIKEEKQKSARQDKELPPAAINKYAFSFVGYIDDRYDGGHTYLIVTSSAIKRNKVKEAVAEIYNEACKQRGEKQKSIMIFDTEEAADTYGKYANAHIPLSLSEKQYLKIHFLAAIMDYLETTGEDHSVMYYPYKS